MASLQDNLALNHLPPEQTKWLAAGEFFFGPPPSRLDLVKRELVSVVDLLRARRAEARRDEAEPPLALAVVRLAAFLAVAIVVTGLLVVGVGSVAVRAALGFVG